MSESTGITIVAGAAGGLGRAVVEELNVRKIPVAAFVHGKSAVQLRAAIEIVVDVTDRAGVRAAVDRVTTEIGAIAGLVNTVAVQDTARLDRLSDAEWDTMMAVNLKGAHNLTQVVGNAMSTGDVGAGSIVHIASIEGHRPAGGHGHYAASKAALISYVKAAAAELGPRGIRVNSVSPGLCHRPGIEDGWREGVERWMAVAPLGRLVSPEDVARACSFLLSPDSAAITGVDLVVDAGVMATAGW